MLNHSKRDFVGEITVTNQLMSRQGDCPPLSSAAAAAAAKSLQSCPTLCNPIDRSPPGFPDPGILQARILAWVALSYSRDLPNPVMEPVSPALQVDSLPAELLGKPYSWSGFPFPAPMHESEK